MNEKKNLTIEETFALAVQNHNKNNCNSTKLIKMLDLLARPRGFEPLTLGLENRCSNKKFTKH